MYIRKVICQRTFRPTLLICREDFFAGAPGELLYDEPTDHYSHSIGPDHHWIDMSNAARAIVDANIGEMTRLAVETDDGRLAVMPVHNPNRLN